MVRPTEASLLTNSSLPSSADLFRCHYAAATQEPSRLKHIVPADPSSVDFYWKQKKRADRGKAALLRQQLLSWEIDEDAARCAAPGPSPKLAARRRGGRR